MLTWAVRFTSIFVFVPHVLIMAYMLQEEFLVLEGGVE